VIPVTFAPRRPGDIASYYASAELAADVLGWHAKRGIAEMCRDAWNWQRKNPNGYLDQ
jgi:UDP-glucose 4-epimerase